MRPRHSIVRHDGGFAYPEILVAMGAAVLMVSVFATTLTQASALGHAARARTQALGVAQAQLEALRGQPFAELSSYAIDQPPIAGEVRVETLGERRKRVCAIARHIDYPSQEVVLVSDVHAQGL